jgi:hypothetical protein
MRVAGNWMLDAGNWMLDAGNWMLDAGCELIDCGLKGIDRQAARLNRRGHRGWSLAKRDNRGLRVSGYELWAAGFKSGCWKLSGKSTAAGPKKTAGQIEKETLKKQISSIE